MTSSPVLLFDSMIVIEAVRTACWNAITGRRQVVTVDTCADELRQGDSSMAAYVPVSEEQLARATVEPLSQFARTCGGKEGCAGTSDEAQGFAGAQLAAQSGGALFTAVGD